MMSNIDLFLKYITFAKYLIKTYEPIISHVKVNDKNQNITTIYNNIKNLNFPLAQGVNFLYDDGNEEEKKLITLGKRNLDNEKLISLLGKISIYLNIIFTFDNKIKIILMAYSSEVKNDFYLSMSDSKLMIGFKFYDEDRTSIDISSIIDMDLNDDENIDIIKSILLKYTLEFGNIKNCLGLM